MTQPQRRPILIVEDVEEISTQMKIMLQAKGHPVLAAANANEAIHAAEKEPPSFILTDLDLPTLGLLVKLVREHRNFKEMVVAVIDINEPQVTAESGLKVLTNFDQLDQLLHSVI